MASTQGQELFCDIDKEGGDHNKDQVHDNKMYVIERDIMISIEAHATECKWR